jgi:hypothetical protein
VIYYQRSYGRPFVSFGIHFAIGAWLNHDFDWRQHHVIVWRHDQQRPPDWWSRRPSARPRPQPGNVTVWQPQNRTGFGGRDLDRGWGSQRQPVTPNASQPRPGTRPAPSTQPRRATPPNARPPGGALIGIQSSREARAFSNRGHDSRQAVERKNEPPQSKPAERQESGKPAARQETRGKR